MHPATQHEPGASVAVQRLRPKGSLRTGLTLRPGENGTKKLMQKYGARLLAVRYRYDVAGQRRLKTVELIEEEMPWTPPPPTRGADDVVFLRIAYDEADLRRRVKAAGAYWQPDRKLWCARYVVVRALGLEERIVAEPG